MRAPRAWLGPRGVATDIQVTCGGGVIQEVGAQRRVPADTEILAVEGFLLPAVADRHVHLGLADPAAVLRGGVTAVRDLAWPPERIFALADASELPSFNGPLVRAAGPMLTAPGGYPTGAGWAPPGTGLELRGAEAAAAAVAELVGLGAAVIKVSLNAEAGQPLGDAELMTVCEAAHAAGLPVTAHAQGSGQVERALGAGVDELAHTPWSHRLSEETIAAVAARQRIVSTLNIHAFGRDTPQLLVAVDNLRRFHDAGGSVIYGTDLGNGPIPPGVDTAELLLMERAGLSRDEVLQALVRAPLEAGAPADLLALGRDPLGDLSAFDDLRLVVRAGQVVMRR